MFVKTESAIVQAVQDHDFMAKFSQQRGDPFIASSERLHDHILLSNAVDNKSQTPRDVNELKRHAIPTGPWEKKGENHGVKTIANSRSEMWRRAFISRLSGALIGGAFLVGPMWLLALKRDVFVHLGVTTGCVAGFGCLMAWYLSTLEAVFVTTLAYSAVLVVFVGVVI